MVFHIYYVTLGKTQHLPEMGTVGCLIVTEVICLSEYITVKKKNATQMVDHSHS